MARYCRNKGIENRVEEGRILEYGRNKEQRRIERGKKEQNLNGK